MKLKDVPIGQVFSGRPYPNATPFQRALYCKGTPTNVTGADTFQLIHLQNLTNPNMGVRGYINPFMEWKDWEIEDYQPIQLEVEG